MVLDAELIDMAIDNLSRVYGQMSLTRLFEQRRTAKSRAWFWACNALIHRRRCQIALARQSWQHAMRLTLESSEVAA